MHPQRIVLVVLATLAAACSGSPGEPSEPLGSTGTADAWPRRGVVHWSQSFLNWDETTIAEAARAGMIIFPISTCLSPDAAPVIGRLRELNPAVRIIGYHHVLAVFELGPDTTGLEQKAPYTLDYWRLVRDHWAWTTAGDTLHIHPGLILLNPIPDGVSDRGLLEGIVDLLEQHINARPGAVDGIMHDYFMYQPYISPLAAADVEGEIDLDGNGIVIGQDAEERALFLRWQKDYAAEIRSRFGPDFIQVANGRVPQQDAELAALMNGIFYELFPNMCWGLTDRAGMQVLLGNHEHGWLSEAQGRTWSIVTNDAVEYNNLFCALTSLLSGCFYAELKGNGLFPGWSVELYPGVPRGDLVIEGHPDSIMTYRREFSRGQVIISFWSFGGRLVWRFEEY